MRLGLRTRVKQVAKLVKTRTTNLAQIEALEEEMRAKKKTTLEEERASKAMPIRVKSKNEARQ
jgi:hypothetical protein